MVVAEYLCAYKELWHTFTVLLWKERETKRFIIIRGSLIFAAAISEATPQGVIQHKWAYAGFRLRARSEKVLVGILASLSDSLSFLMLRSTSVSIYPLVIKYIHTQYDVKVHLPFSQFFVSLNWYEKNKFFKTSAKKTRKKIQQKNLRIKTPNRLEKKAV